MGDSTTAGTPAFASPVETPPAGKGDPTSQYSYWLMQSHPEWEVLNRGVNGERSDQIRARFERDVVAARPALVVLIAGVNDVYQGRPVDVVTGHLRWMYDRARKSGIRVVAGTILPYDTATPEQNLKMHRSTPGSGDRRKPTRRSASSIRGLPLQRPGSRTRCPKLVTTFTRHRPAIGRWPRQYGR